MFNLMLAAFGRVRTSVQKAMIGLVIALAAMAVSMSPASAQQAEDATLSALSLSSGPLSPVFDAGTTSYTTTVPNGTTIVNVTPTVSQAGATVTVNGFLVTPGSVSVSIALWVGSNTISTVVTAPDGTTTKTYTATVTRERLALSPPGLSAGMAGVAYARTFGTTGGVAPYDYAITGGTLPAGLTLTSNGTLSGTPTAGGSFNFTVTATDSSTGAGAPYSTARDYTLTVGAPSITLLPTTVPVPKVAVAYSRQITAANGTGPYTYVVSAGTLPDGLTLSPAGLLEGMPSRVATFNFTVRATDSSTGTGPFNGARAYSVTVSPPTPTVASISPTAGPTTGGTGVVITGTGFTGATAVTFGATAATAFAIDSATQITATAPAGTGTGTGTVDVRVTTPGGTSATSAADQFTYVTAPNVLMISPSTGPSTGGTTVLITGGGFSGATAVTFGATPATGFTVNSATQITATAPAGAGTVDVRVTTAGGTSPALAWFTYAPAPTVTSISPAEGPPEGGTTVVVTGAGFLGVTEVRFGLSLATSFSFDSATQITATAPAGTGTVDVRVTTAQGGISATSAADRFTYFGAPTVTNLTQGVVYNTPTEIDLTGAISGAHTIIEVVSTPAHGTTSVLGDVVTYTPITGYSGADSFTWTATGPGGTSTAATVTLTVAAPTPPDIDQPTDPVVVPPTAGGGSESVSVDLDAGSSGLIEGYRITVTSQFGAAEIVEGGSSGPAMAGGSASPKAAGGYQLLYTPAANFMGEDTVTLVAYGPGGDSTPVTFTFQVSGKAPDLSGQAASGASATFAPTSGLVGGPFQALRIIRAPAFGTATVNGLTIVFTPGANAGATSLDYVIDLPFGASAPGLISVTSNPLPGSEALVAQTLQGVPVTVRISNVAGGPFTGAAVVSMAPASAGEASIASVGGGVYDLTFTSTGSFSGEAVVNYSLTNAFGTTNSTLTVTVEARPDPSLDPEVRGLATGQVTSARRFADAQINNFQQRLRDLHDGANGSSNGLSLNLGMGGADAARDPQQALRRQLGQGDNLDPGALGDGRDREMMGLDVWAGRAQATAGPVGPTDGRLNAASTPPAADGGASVGFWTSGSVDWGRQDATGQRDSRFTTQGATVGLDVKVSDQLIVGGGVGYGEDKTRIGDNGSVANGKAFTGALYASWRPAEAFYVDGLLGYANLDFTSRRWVEGLGGQSDGYADGDRSGDVRFASAAFGRVLRGERVTSDFYARLDARDIALDGFTETGGGLSALIWDDVEQTSLSANLGASWRWTLDSRRYGQFVPTARLEWSHEFEDIGAQGVRYADWATSPTYLVPLNAWSRNAINLNLGTEWSLSDRLMLSLGYRGALGQASTSHGAQIGMKYGW